MKNNRITCGAIAFVLAVLSAGCGNKIPDLSEQEQELVVEYAASVVLKHDANHQSKLVDLSLEQENMEMEKATEDEAQGEKEDAGEDTADTEDVTVTDNTQSAEIQNVTMEEFLKVDSVKFTYTGYETDDFYPEQGDDLYFVMSATAGNKLLVLKFLAENTTGADVNLDLAKTETRFKIVADGVEKNALTTMLLNDLPYYQGTIAPGENVELVLVCEIPEEQAEIASLELIMKNVDDSATISLN